MEGKQKFLDLEQKMLSFITTLSDIIFLISSRSDKVYQTTVKFFGHMSFYPITPQRAACRYRVRESNDLCSKGYSSENLNFSGFK